MLRITGNAQLLKEDDPKLNETDDGKSDLSGRGAKLIFFFFYKYPHRPRRGVTYRENLFISKKSNVDPYPINLRRQVAPRG